MSSIRINRATTLGLLSTFAAVLTTACSSNPSAPVVEEGSPKNSVVSMSITIDPSTTQRYALGTDHFVQIPAGAVCALGTTYGAGEWDKPCTPATGRIAVDVVVTTRDGIPSATFFPDLRFAPAAADDLANWVYLGLKVRGAAGNAGSKGYAILYRPTGSDDSVDESVEDPTLRAFRYQGLVVRRLKHFSGYNVSLGSYAEQSGNQFASVLGATR